MEPHTSPTIPVPPVPRWATVPVVEPIVPDALPVPPVVEAVPDALPVPDPVPTAVISEQKSPRPMLAVASRPRGVLAVADELSHRFDAVTETLLGLVFMPVGLAILASLPLLNFLALGYLLEAGARIARSGRFRDGFFGIRWAGRVGGLLLGIYLTLVPVQLISSMVQSSELIDPLSATTRNWAIGRTAATVAAVLHIVLACLWGGRLRHFLLPLLHPLFAVLAILRGNPLVRCRDGVWTFFVEAQPWYYFWLGFRGAAGALLWLALPVTLLALGWRFPLLGVLGFFLMLPVLVVLPFLQMNFAARGRFADLFNVWAVLRLYIRAPWAFTFALFITLLFALPLYLLKIELVPRDALMIPSLVFVAFIWPARLLTGWVCGRALRRGRRSHWFFWLTGWFPIPAFVLVYGFFVWLSQYVSWNGAASLYEQHAFLLPVPFTGL